MKVWSRRVLTATVTSAVVIAGVGASMPAHAQTSWLDDLVGTCPDLYALGVQGTGESAPDAPVKADTGMLGTVLAPLLDLARTAGASVDRAYVPYPAAFGGVVPGGMQSYAVSVTEARNNLDAAAGKIVDACPATKLAVVGFSQGAHAASDFLQDVGHGTGPVPASAVAAGALFGSPTRAAGSGIFPGTSQVAPSPVPGTAGEAVKALPAVSYTAPAGAGIAPETAAGYGSLTGRVSSWCQSGDLSCDAPQNAPIARAVVNVAGQAEIGGDPFVALHTIGLALGSTAFTVAVDVVNEDLSVPKNALENLSIQPKKTLSQRLAEASDPRSTPPTGQEALAALMKVGLVAVNSVVSVARKVITPETIAAVASIGLVDPAAAFGVIAAKAADAVIDLVPPTTTRRVVKQSFDIVENEIEANRDLFGLSVLAKYRDVAREHGSYGSTPVTASGQAPTRFVASWLAAAAHDLAGTAHNTSATMASTTSFPRPTSTTPTGTSVPGTSTVTTSSDAPFTQGGLTSPIPDTPKGHH